ncbi:MAG: type IV secretion system protein [Patescibacteria group bacterium]
MKFLPDKKYILIAIVALAIALGPFTAKTASAVWPFPTLEGTVAAIGNLILWLVSWILWLTAHLFEYTLKLTLENSSFAKISAVNLGWAIVRDVVNLFFIFILLYIAIGAILRLAGHDAKKLLVNLILAALLINFSLVITKVVIDASNILALEFYAKINGDTEDTRGNIVKGPGVTRTLMNGLHLASVYDSEILKTSSKTPNREQAAYYNIILGTLGGSALILVTAFVFLAATFLFITRTIVLWFLMILSPLAFGAMILPQTKKHADRWWQELTCQCLLAPAFMFMIYLVVMIISKNDFSDAISKIGLDVSDNNFAAAFASGLENALGVVLNFVLLIGLMVGSLIISKNLACAGGSQALAAAAWTKGKVQGYAKHYGKRGAGWLAEKGMKEAKEMEEKGGVRGGIMKYAGRIPGVGRGLAALSGEREKELAAKRKQYEKQYKGYSEAGLETMLESPIITSGKRKVIGSILTERRVKEEADAREKAIEAKEDTEYQEIAGEERTIKDDITGESKKIRVGGKLKKINDQLNKITEKANQDINTYLDGIKTELENLRGIDSGRASTKREELIHQQGKVNRLMEDKAKLETREEQLEGKQRSRTEKKKLEARLGKVEEKSEEKPPIKT